MPVPRHPLRSSSLTRERRDARGRPSWTRTTRSARARQHLAPTRTLRSRRAHTPPKDRRARKDTRASAHPWLSRVGETQTRGGGSAERRSDRALLLSRGYLRPAATARIACVLSDTTRSFRTTPRGGDCPRRGSRTGRASVQSSLVRRDFGGASSLSLLKRPSARRGPGIVSVDRNVRSKCRCSCVLQFTS